MGAFFSGVTILEIEEKIPLCIIGGRVCGNHNVIVKYWCIWNDTLNLLQTCDSVLTWNIYLGTENTPNWILLTTETPAGIPWAESMTSNQWLKLAAAANNVPTSLLYQWSERVWKPKKHNISCLCQSLWLKAPFEKTPKDDWTNLVALISLLKVKCKWVDDRGKSEIAESEWKMYESSEQFLVCFFATDACLSFSSIIQMES